MTVEVGSKIKGKVSGITNFGAFVDFGDHETGLVHISQVSDRFIKDIHDVLSVGDEVEAKVIKVADDGKIALSMKQLQDEEHGGRHEHQQHHDFHDHREHDHQNFEHRHPHYHHERRGYSALDGDRGNEHFNDMLANYMKESESRLSTLKRQTDGKRGGRGGRRS